MHYSLYTLDAVNYGCFREDRQMDAQKPKPLVALVVGDPAGIGPELAAKLAADSSVAEAVRLLVVGDRRIFDRGAEIARNRRRRRVHP